jgi:diacylglycerol kinase (ATP)
MTMDALKSRARSFVYAFSGIVSLLVSQPNARIHAFVTLVVLAAGFFIGLSRVEWCVIVITIAAVWTAEALNTSLEFLADATSPGLHPLVKKAKDIAAGGVLVAAVASVIVGVIIFGPRILSLLIN